MNNGLYRLHRVLFIGYMSFMVIMALIGVMILFNHGDEAAIGLVGIGVLPLAAFHYYAAVGVRTGKAWGRTMSRIIASIALFGVPIGTIMGIYIFSATGKKWQGESSKETSTTSLKQ